jgi:Leucine-rich repeat (LRR) protein
MDYAIRRRGLSSLPELEKNFSLAIEDLVGKITDIEPHEPYWEYMRQLSLKGQKLWTLHMLADFCSRVEELDVSKNELGQLNGAPRSLQVLSANNNHLSTLTAWAHLPNLQYLDVSYNKISSMKSFSCLIHLRDLNLEGNEIESLEGICDLSSVISLNLRGNKLKKLDLRGMNL